MRYTLKKGVIIEGGPADSDFTEEAGYYFVKDNFKCAYILPAVTQNDIRWRMNSEELSSLDQKILLDDTYRLCTNINKGALWIGTDGEVLYRYLKKDTAGLQKIQPDHFRHRSIPIR